MIFDVLWVTQSQICPSEKLDPFFDSGRTPNIRLEITGKWEKSFSAVLQKGNSAEDDRKERIYFPVQPFSLSLLMFVLYSKIRKKESPKQNFDLKYS